MHIIAMMLEPPPSDTEQMPLRCVEGLLTFNGNGGELEETSDHGGMTQEERNVATHLLEDPLARYSLAPVFRRSSWTACEPLEEDLTWEDENEEDSNPQTHVRQPRRRRRSSSLFFHRFGTATVWNEVVNLVKNIIGSGGLSLPAAIAAYGNAPSAIVPSLILILIMAVVNAYSFSLLGRVCAVTHATTYQQAWTRSRQHQQRRRQPSHNNSNDSSSSPQQQQQPSSNNSVLVGMVVTTKAFLGCWSFSIIIGTTVQPLVKLVGSQLLHAAGSTNNPSFLHLVNPSATLVLVTVLVLLPMCLMERLVDLYVFSLVGTLGTLLTALTMMVRYLDGSYHAGGKFYNDVPDYFQPSFGNQGASGFFSIRSLILVSILTTGYVAHYNAPKFYFELKEHTTGRFNVVVNVSFFFAALTYMATSSLGFLTFGEHCSGFILDNYSYRDPLATLSRLGIAVSVIACFPLIFFGGRDGLMELLQQLGGNVWGRCQKQPQQHRKDTLPGSVNSTYGAMNANNESETVGVAAAASRKAWNSSQRRPDSDDNHENSDNRRANGATNNRPQALPRASRTITVFMLTVITLLAIFINDLTFVLSFSGATLSTLIIYVFPPLMFRSMVRNCQCLQHCQQHNAELKWAMAMLWIGSALGIAGATLTVVRTFFHVLT